MNASGPTAGGAPGRRPGRRPGGGSGTGGGGAGRGAAGPPRRPATRRPPEVDRARQTALDLLTAIRDRSAYANLVLPGMIRANGLTGPDAALATELAYGSCRVLGQLDAVIAACGDRPLDRLDGVVHDALRLGAYQLLHTRIPDHAAVSVTVDLVRAGAAPGAAGYVNAVLRRIAGADLDAWIDRLAPDRVSDPRGHLAFATAHPRWIADAVADALGPRADAELAGALGADNVPPAVHLLARPGRIDRDELLGQAAAATPARFSPFGVYLGAGDPAGLAAVGQGRAAVQDEGSQLVTLALAGAEVSGADERWLDLCAGPGGKAGLLGALADQRGARVDAVEITPHRADLVRRTVAGLPVTVHVADGRDPGLRPGYDRVLVDAPCTGLGALRRRPEARWRRRPEDVADLARLQGELLAAAARLVRPGGVIAYVTCSPHPAETAAVVAGRPAGLALTDARGLLPGVPDIGDGPFVQLWPHRHGTDAMFLALLRRT